MAVVVKFELLVSLARPCKFEDDGIFALAFVAAFRDDASTLRPIRLVVDCCCDNC